jgi:hypothetical protein
MKRLIKPIARSQVDVARVRNQAPLAISYDTMEKRQNNQPHGTAISSVTANTGSSEAKSEEWSQEEHSRHFSTRKKCALSKDRT